MKVVNEVADLVKLTGMRIADTKYLDYVNEALAEKRPVALIGYEDDEEFENIDKLAYIPDLFDADRPFLELDNILNSINKEYSAVIIISDRRRISNFKIPSIQLIPEDINIELETVAVLSRDRLIDTIRKFLNKNNLLDQSLNTLFISELSMIDSIPDGQGIALELVIMRSFDFKKAESLEKRRKEKPLNSETSRFRNYIIEPFPIEQYNLISAYRESSNLKYSRNLIVRVIDEEDLDLLDVSSRIKQIILVDEKDYKRLKELKVPEYLEFFILKDDVDREAQIKKIIEFGKRGYDLVIIDQKNSMSHILPDLIHGLNLYAERFKISFTPNVNYLVRAGLSKDANILELDCSKSDRDSLYDSIIKGVEENKLISLENLPEDETFFLVRVYRRIKDKLNKETPIVLYFPEGTIITKLSMLSRDINQFYRANRILIGNQNSDRTRIDRFMLLTEGESQ